MKKVTTLLVMLLLTMYIVACAPVAASTTKTSSGTGTSGTSGTPSSKETVVAAPSTGNLEELIAMVNSFVASGDITGQAENGLLAKLDTIKQKVLKGQFGPAANELAAFVNEVQAQFGKKISEAAATALIAKAQEVAAEFIAGVPVTGGEGTVVASTAQATDSSMGNTSKPTPMGKQVEHQTQWDGIAAQVAQSLGFSTFNYDLYQLPANTSWEDTLVYYKTQAATAGWGDAPSQTSEMAGGHYAVWSVTGSDGTMNQFVVVQAESDDNAFTLNIFGNK